MSHARTLESRRNSGERVSSLPLIVGGRPEPDEWGEAPPELCICPPRKRTHLWWCPADVWAEIVPQLVEANLIDRVDRQGVMGYCIQVGRARALREEIEWDHEPARYSLDQVLQNPKTVGKRTRRRTLTEQLRARTTRGVSANPLLAHERDAWREARLMALDLGLNPVSRTKIRAAGKGERRGRGLEALNDGLPRRPALAAVE